MVAEELGEEDMGEHKCEHGATMAEHIIRLAGRRSVAQETDGVWTVWTVWTGKDGGWMDVDGWMDDDGPLSARQHQLGWCLETRRHRRRPTRIHGTYVNSVYRRIGSVCICMYVLACCSGRGRIMDHAEEGRKAGCICGLR